MIDQFVIFVRSILSDNWFAWFYQYLFGGLFFFLFSLADPPGRDRL